MPTERIEDLIPNVTSAEVQDDNGADSIYLSEP